MICPFAGFDRITMMKPLKRSTNGGPVSSDIVSKMPPERILFITKELSTQPQSKSEPIPIKKHKTEDSESIDPYDSADMHAQYEFATWVMYMRITTARRIRALSSSLGDRICSTETSNDGAAHTHVAKPSIAELDMTRKHGCRNPFPRPMSPDLDQSSFDVCSDGIFELE